MSVRELFGALPDDVVQHVLSFLPSRDAVKSVTLSRRWRHLWRSTPAVRVSGSGDGFRLFVNSLLLQREVTSPLLSFEIEADLLVGPEGYVHDEFCGGDHDPREVDPHIDLWIRHAVRTCRARSLTASFQSYSAMWFPNQRQPFASPHLTTMRLHRVQLNDGRLDFSCCQALLNLTLGHCLLDGVALVSPSLERLDIIGCLIPKTYGPCMGMRIATPRLRYLHLSDDYDYDYDYFPGVSDCTTLSVLLLQTMPLLTSASIQLIGSTTIDHDAIADRPLLLHRMSEATNLELIASTEQGREIFLRDLTWCPTFNKLKTLMLNEWCVYDDVTALACLMQHAPRLENLILRLKFEKTHVLEVKTEESHMTSEHACHTFEHLKTVEIKKCRPSYDIRVNEILKLLSDWGIPGSKISIDYKKPKDKKTHTKF